MVASGGGGGHVPLLPLPPLGSGTDILVDLFAIFSDLFAVFLRLSGSFCIFPAGLFAFFRGFCVFPGLPVLGTVTVTLNSEMDFGYLRIGTKWRCSLRNGGRLGLSWFNWWVSFAPEFQCCYFCEPSCLFFLSFNFDFYVSKIMHL